MLGRLINSMKCGFSIRLKGPVSQRNIDKSALKLEEKRQQSFFKDYYQQTNQFYKDGFTANEINNFSDMVKQTFSLENATANQILQYRKQQAIKKYQRNLLDHGSPAIQCALMSEEIILLMNHVTRYPKDKRAGRFLTKLIQKRRNMLNYCMRKDYHRYKWVCVDYGIPDVHPKNSHHMTSWERFYNNWSGY